MPQSSFAQQQIMPGQKRKTGPLCSSYLHKGPALSCRAAKPYGCKGRLQILGGRFRLAFRGTRRQFHSSGSDYFFFFVVFLATFLVAALAVFFAFFAFLAMWSSLIHSLGRRAHVVHRHAQQ
jgi:hypothetical protein